jgi:formate dehydrogenase subunit gamma
MPEDKDAEARISEKLKRDLEKEISQELTYGVELTPEMEEKIKKTVSQKVSEELKKKMEAELKRISKKKKKEEGERKKKEEILYTRLTLNQRVQHIILMISVIILILTGLPIKFHDSAWAKFFFPALGGIETTRLWHRIGAVGLIGIALYHLLYLGLSKEGRETFRELLPRRKDIKDVWMMVNFLLGRSNERPRLGKFTYIEKFDYWAVYWGMVIMVGSGLILWFVNYALKIFPKFVADIATEAHSDEALLATLAIIIWHLYNAHLNPDKFPMNKSWLNGKISEEEMKKEHYLEWLKIQEKKEKNKETKKEGEASLKNKEEKEIF